MSELDKGTCIRQMRVPKALIVDDIPENLLALETTLSELAVEVIQANSGKEALALMLRHDFAVVLLDINMPEMGGIETAALMQGHEKTMHVPVIFVTGQSLDEMEQLEGYSSGAVDYIIKPYNSNILLSKVGVFLDLSLQSKEIEEQHKQTQRLLELMPDGIVVLGHDNKVRYGNPAAARLFNCEAEQLQDSDICFPLSSTRDMEISIENYIVEIRIAPVNWNGEQNSLIVLHDITNRKKIESELIQLAQYDPLTGLANRHHCVEYLNKALAQSKRRNGYLAVLFLDLDKFKDVNDALGHSQGDSLLRLVAKILKANIREGDLAARFGGDEFVLVLDEIAHPEDAAVVAQNILDAMKLPQHLNEKPVVIGCSIGIATYPLCGEDPDTLFKAADIAMYHAKSKGRNNYQFFAKDMQKQLMHRLGLEEDLRQAIQRDELKLHYQPQVDINNNRIIAMEALLRWQHKDIGLISPDKFIPIAEKAGLITDIGEWVLRTACQQAKVWQRDYLKTQQNESSALTISVNVSIDQLNHGDFEQRVANVLKDTAYDPECLELELTESKVMADPEATSALFGAIREKGVSIAVDDFGTGYSSLSYLQHLSLNTLKIDRSFVKNIGNDQHAEVIIKTIIAMAHNLNLRVVAEGVENIQQINFLRQNKCDVMQGHYFAKPLPFQQATMLIESGLISHRQASSM